MSNNKKKSAMICSAVGIIIVLAVAITVPIIHNSKVSAELSDTQSITETVTAVTTEATTSEPTTVVIETVAADKVEETEALTTKAAESTTKKSSPATTAAAQKSTPTPAPTAAPTTKAAETTTAAPTTEGKKMWTQAEIDSIVSEVKAYAVSRNLGINSSLTTNGTSWMNPQWTDWNTRSNLVSHLKDEIDFIYDLSITDGVVPDGRPCLNVIAKPTTEGQYEIYIVY